VYVPDSPPPEMVTPVGQADSFKAGSIELTMRLSVRGGAVWPSAEIRVFPVPERGYSE